MIENTQKRRLSAILAADVAGYTRLVEQDTDGTVAAWQAARADVIDPVIAKHSGRIVKHTGDGFLAEFATVHDAVNCAIAMQEGLAEGTLQFRMGVNLGDIIDDGEDIHGEGVNIAARIEALAEPGSISVSGAVYEQVRNRVDCPFEDLGEHEVKHVSQPVRVYRIAVAKARPEKTEVTGPALASHDGPSIAVLPFDNMSGDPEQVYFADGIAEDIITALSKISGLFVIARNSTFTYKGQAVKVQEVSNALGVRHVLEGSVRKSGDRVRITAQLVDGATGGHLWAERYDRDLEDVFAVQDEVTRRIVAALEVELKAGEGERLIKHETDDIRCYDCLLRGRELFMRFTKEENLQARQAFEEALEIDPTCAPAYARLAQTYAWEAQVEWSDAPERSAKLAMEHAEKALSIDDSLPLVHGVLGNIYLWAKQHDRAISEMERWIELDPNQADAYLGLAQTLNFAGRAEEALPLLERSQRLNPNYGFLTLFALGQAHYLLGSNTDAIQAFERSAIRNPEFGGTLIFLAASYAKEGEFEKARHAIARAREHSPKLINEKFIKTVPFKRTEDMADLVDALKIAGISL